MMKIILLLLIFGFSDCSCVIFNCKFYSTNWNYIGTIYRCSLKSTVDGKTFLEVVKGEHSAGKNNSDVQGLYAANIELSHIPKNTEKFFPNLRGIRLYNTSTVTISAEALRPFPGLYDFSVQSNYYLETLPDNLFAFTPKLRFISFFDNSISYIGNNFLDDLRNLTAANFLRNFCVDRYANTSLQIQLLQNSIDKDCANGLRRPTRYYRATVSSSSITSTLPRTTSSTSRTTTGKPSSSQQIDSLQSAVTKMNETISQLLKTINGQKDKILVLENRVDDLSNSACCSSV